MLHLLYLIPYNRFQFLRPKQLHLERRRDTFCNSGSWWYWHFTLGRHECSTMGVGCQSRRFNCLFWRETRQRILGHEISPYTEVVRGGEWELTTRPSRDSWTGAEAVGVDPRRGSQHQTPSREARRQDRVQWRRVSRCLIPVALWNFR